MKKLRKTEKTTLNNITIVHRTPTTALPTYMREPLITGPNSAWHYLRRHNTWYEAELGLKLGGERPHKAARWLCCRQLSLASYRHKTSLSALPSSLLHVYLYLLTKLCLLKRWVQMKWVCREKLVIYRFHCVCILYKIGVFRQVKLIMQPYEFHNMTICKWFSKDRIVLNGQILWHKACVRKVDIIRKVMNFSRAPTLAPKPCAWAAVHTGSSVLLRSADPWVADCNNIAVCCIKP